MREFASSFISSLLMTLDSAICVIDYQQDYSSFMERSKKLDEEISVIYNCLQGLKVCGSFPFGCTSSFYFESM